MWMTPTGEYSISTQPSTSPNQTWSPSTSSSNTPAKRVAILASLDKIFQNEVLTPKQSTTKSKHLKKE
ncbi:unnamed protein product [Lathyrus sativus]|nr:unnamed protein product [Lathyrus sativus]